VRKKFHKTTAFWQTHIDDDFLSMLHDLRRAESDMPSRTRMVERILVDEIPRRHADLQKSGRN
jgi:hypothetical protein